MKYTFTDRRQMIFGLDDAAGAALIAGVSQVAGQGIQMASTKLNNTKNYNRQRALMDKQFGMNKEMAEFNQANQMEMWRETGPVGQMEQLKLAGLNPALMYKQGGAGGTTAAAEGGAVSQPSYHGDNPGAGAAATGMGLAQIAMMKAQIDNLNSSTNKNNADAAKTAGVDTDLGKTQIASLQQGIQNQVAQKELTESQTELNNIQAKIQSSTVEEQIASINIAMQNLEQTNRMLVRNNFIDQETANTKIAQAKAQLASTIAGTTLQKELATLPAQQIKDIESQIYNRLIQQQQGWQSIEKDWNGVNQNIKESANRIKNGNMTDSDKIVTEFIKGLLHQ